MTAFDPRALDRSVHAPVRLAAMAALYSGGRETFSGLKRVTGATDGNLTGHMQALEQEGLIKVRKQFVGKVPQTSYELTPRGRQVFRGYVDNLSRLVSQCARPGKGA
jgi:DNA-binding HxlR family transcriptional regulator